MKLTAGIFFLLLFQLSLPSQTYLFFNDSPNNTSYDASSGFFTGSSILVLSNGKIPVDVDNKYSGTNALRLRWKSAAGGDWGIAVAATGLPAFDFTSKDSLTFWIMSKAEVDSANLPLVYLEDEQSKRTNKQSIHINKLSANAWTKISLPLQLFFNSPGDADLTKIKYIYFGQNSADNTLRTIYIDEIRVISAEDSDNIPPAVPAGFSAMGYTTYVYLKWQKNTESDLAGYRIYRFNGSEYTIVASAPKNATYHNDNTGAPPKTYSYKISAFDLSGNESALSDSVSASTISKSDDELMDIVQEATFKYFWDYAHPVSGLSRERLGSGDVVTSGGSGFGVMALLVGVERGYITRDEAKVRMLKILDFLSIKAERFHGAYSHWLNGTTGKAIPFSEKDDGGDLVETAYLIQGLLTARQYFNENNADEELIRTLITSIWESVEWDWYRRDSNSNFLYWHWSPNYNWEMNFALQGPNETMITYLLAIASPTHSIPASLFHSGWASSPYYKNGKSFYGIPLEVGWDYGGPLFFAQYSFLGFDPRYKKDAYTNYYINNRSHSLIHQAYSVDNPKNFPGYDADTWGLTASDDPFGYMAHEPNNDNGTISPTAALSSMPYTPNESLAALRSFYYEYGSSLFGTYGFKDAFNLKENWFADSYIAIDQGPIIVMIENYRTQLLWNNFMANQEIQPMLDAIGFVPDSTSTGLSEESGSMNSFKLIGNYPNPFNPVTTIEFSIPSFQNVFLTVYDILGKKIKTLIDDELNAGVHKIQWNGADDSGNKVSSGIYLYRITTPENSMSEKMILQK